MVYAGRHKAAPTLILCAMIVGALGARGAMAAHSRAAAAVTGAGSTFVAPLLLGQWIPSFTAANPAVPVTYSAIGSGNGITQWTAGQVDFAASDALLTTAQDQAALAHCGAITVIPATISAVAIIYNVPGMHAGLHLSPAVIAGIFLGRITNWSDTAIQALNAGVRLPNLAIQIVHRSDGSGTSYIMTNYLASVSADWRNGPGAAATVNWPAGVGAKGSAGIVQTVSTTLGAISYVDLAYAVQDNIDFARVENASGAFLAPSTAAASVAADSFAPSMPANLQQIIVNSRVAGAYPITGYSYLLFCTHQSGAIGQALLSFVRFAVTTGQASVKTLYYAPLPMSVRTRDTAALDKISVSGP